MKKFLRLRWSHPSFYVRQSLSRKCCSTTSSTSSSSTTDGTQDQSGIPKTFHPEIVEKEVLKKWERFVEKRRKRDDGYEVSPAVFRMLLPPPNVTGKLHLGHFLTIAVEDTIARWKFMNGVKVEWIPGFDHAGIATQSLVNKKMGKQLEASDLGTALEEFSRSNLVRIREQLKSTGALLNWDEGYYTLNEAHSSVVQEAFIQLFESGLIKRADGIVNWSCALNTTIADIEVDEIDFENRTTIKVPNYKDPVEFGLLYYIAYRFLDSEKEYLVVATSRPETMFGDVALAVNPEDSRYVQLIGKRVVSPINGSVLPVIGDSRVKADFGTGVVKITPAHDKLDFAIGSSQKLPSVDILTNDGVLNEKCGEFQGLPRFTARKKVLKLLEERGAIVEAKPYSGCIHVCSRSGDVIEPKLVPHWFLKTQFLSSRLIQAINDKSFVIVPENHSRSLIHKLMDSQDWCLSRQIQWGHRIPAFYCTDFPETWVAASDMQAAAVKLEKVLGCSIDKNKLVQDSDVLDTWFSSALIPLSVSGWPDSETFKDITLMETGHDILLFWVWRMAIMTLALVDRFPFRYVLLHGIVTDSYGRKMSKSKGNVIDPLHIVNGISYRELIEEAEQAFASGELDENEYNLRKVALQRNHSGGFPVCGTDALRLTLLSQDIFDQEITLDLTYLDNCKRFSNKLWQALRFLKMHSGQQEGRRDNSSTYQETATAEVACKWILSCLYELNKTAETSLNQGKLHIYAEAIRKFFYQELCDVYIELVKGAARAGSDTSKYISIMQYAFETGVKIAHPIIPFVTEEIWSFLRNERESSLLEQDFPASKDLEHFFDPDLMDTMGKAMHLTSEIRGVKRRGGWTSKAVPEVYVELDEKLQTRVKELADYIQNLAGALVTFGRHPQSSKGIYGTFLVDVQGYIGRIHIPLLDPNAKTPNQAKIEKLKLKLLKLQQQYDSPSFQQSAPPETKEKLKKKVETLLLQINESSKSNPSRPKDSTG